MAPPKKILLITGGAGYIGSHAVVAFEEAGYMVVILDNFSNSSRDTLSGIEKILGYCPDFYECDIRDSDSLEEIFEKYHFDGVIHFAGLKAVAESCDDVSRYHDNNIGGSIALFSTMEKYNVKKIIFSSSATVYRADNAPPFREDMPTGTTNPYGTTKLIIEKLIEDYALQAEWEAVNLRYFNPIGAHPSGYIGESPRGIPNNLLPYVLDVARGVRDEVTVFGGDYETSDGTGGRDYIDIGDLIRAHTLAYEKLTKGSVNYNVGTGRVVTVLEMIHAVEKISGRKVPYTVTARRGGDLPIVYASSDRIREALGWEAESSLEESVASAWRFIQTKSHEK